MGILTDYFAAPDDARAAVAAPTGPSAPDFLTSQPGFATVELTGINPFVVLGSLASLLTGRPYREVTADARHGSLVASVGDEGPRSEEHTSELQSRENLVCRLLLE